MGTNTIELSVSTVKDLMWCSARYAIGRKTGVSSDTARTIIRIISRYKGLLDEQWRMQFCRDVRAYISDTVRFCPNISLKNEYNDINNFDAYSLVTKWLADHDGAFMQQYDFEVNCATGLVKATKLERGCELSCREFPNHYIDEWLQLVNYLDESKWANVTVDFNGVVSRYTCIEVQEPFQVYDEKKHTTIGYRFKTVYKPIDSLPTPKWISSEYITQVEK